MASDTVLQSILKGVTPGAVDDIWHQAFQDDNKDRLRAQTEHAGALKIFGAPVFMNGDEMFWGNDRLESALTFNPP